MRIATWDINAKWISWPDYYYPAPWLGALGRLSADRQEGAEARPLGGWAARVGGDILPPGTRLILAFDVQGGMLGKPFYLNGTFGLGFRL